MVSILTPPPPAPPGCRDWNDNWTWHSARRSCHFDSDSNAEKAVKSPASVAKFCSVDSASAMLVILLSSSKRRWFCMQIVSSTTLWRVLGKNWYCRISSATFWYASRFRNLSSSLFPRSVTRLLVFLGDVHPPSLTASCKNPGRQICVYHGLSVSHWHKVFLSGVLSKVVVGGLVLCLLTITSHSVMFSDILIYTIRYTIRIWINTHKIKT